MYFARTNTRSGESWQIKRYNPLTNGSLPIRVELDLSVQDSSLDIDIEREMTSSLATHETKSRFSRVQIKQNWKWGIWWDDERQSRDEKQIYLFSRDRHARNCARISMSAEASRSSRIRVLPLCFKNFLGAEETFAKWSYKSLLWSARSWVRFPRGRSLFVFNPAIMIVFTMCLFWCLLCYYHL